MLDYVQFVVKVLELDRTISVRRMQSELSWLGNPFLLLKTRTASVARNLVTVEGIVKQHWATFARHYYTRFEYENVDVGAAKELMAHLVKLQSSISDVNEIIKGIPPDVANFVNADEFENKDPADGSISKHQGIRYLFEAKP